MPRDLAPEGSWRRVARNDKFHDQVPSLRHAFTQVKNAPSVPPHLLQHEINVSTYRQIGIAIKASYETLHCLLDSEIALRR